MALQFQPLPLEIFSEKQKPYIARLNSQLRDLFALEGVIRNPIESTRSDNTVVRGGEFQVDVSRITPSIASVVSGVSTVVGTPALTFGTANTVGSTTTAVSINSAIALFGTTAPSDVTGAASVGTGGWAARGDHVHAISTSVVLGNTAPESLAGASSAGSATWAARNDHVHVFPQTIQSASGGTDSITLSQSGTDLTLSWSNQGLKTFEGGTASSFVFQKTSDMTGGNIISVNADLDNATTGLIGANWSAGNPTSKTVRCWDARYSVSGGLSASVLIGFDTSAFNFVPSSGSSFNNSIYCGRMSGPTISIGANNAFGCSEVSTLLLEGMRRSGGSWQGPVTTLGTLILEPPTYAVTATGLPDQIGLLIRQRTAGQVATNRYGIKIDAQNSGTSRYSIYGDSDMAYFTGPVRVGGRLAHDGLQVGFYGTSTIAQSTGWSASGFTESKTLNGASFSLNEVMSVLNTLVTHFVNRGDLAA